MTNTNQTDLQVQLDAAHAAEMRIVGSLPERPTKAQLERAWAAVEASNRARRLLAAARGV